MDSRLYRMAQNPWKDLIRAYNWEVFGHRTFIDGIPEDLPIPDYTKLKYER